MSLLYVVNFLNFLNLFYLHFICCISYVWFFITSCLILFPVNLKFLEIFYFTFVRTSASVRTLVSVHTSASVRTLVFVRTSASVRTLVSVRASAFYTSSKLHNLLLRIIKVSSVEWRIYDLLFKPSSILFLFVFSSLCLSFSLK